MNLNQYLSELAEHLESRLAATERRQTEIERRLAALEAASAAQIPLAILLRIEGKVDKIMTIQSDVDDAVRANTAAVNDAIADITQLKGQITDLGTQITALQAQVAAGNVDPTAIAADLAALKASHDAIVAALPAPVVPVTPAA